MKVFRKGRNDIKNNSAKIAKRFIAFLLLVAVVFGVGKETVINVRKTLLDDSNAPAHSKTLTPNNDGTYKLSLNVTGDAETSEIKKANVIVVLDVSGSMSFPTNTAGATAAYGNTVGRYHRNCNDNGVCSYRRLYYYQDGKYYKEGTNPDGTASNTRHSTVYYGNDVDSDNDIDWRQYTGTRYNFTNNTSRMDVAQEGVDNLINTLLAQNGSSDITDIVEISYITFSTRSQFVTPTSASGSGWISGTDGSSLIASVDSTYPAGGTNWDAALYNAKRLADAKNDGDKTYIVLFSDGNPTYHNGNASSPTNHTHSTGNPSNDGSGSTTGTNDINAAYYEAKQLFGDRYDLYGIFAYGGTDGANYMKNLVSYGNFNDITATHVADVEGNFYFASDDDDAIKAAFDKIANSIADSLGVTGVSIKDPTTSGVSLSSGNVSGDGLLDVEPSSEYEYFLIWNLDSSEGNNTYKSELAINKLKRTYTITDSGSLNSDEYRDIRIYYHDDDVTIDETYQGKIYIDTSSGTTKYVVKLKWESGNDTDFYKKAPVATFDSNGAVNWDLSGLGTLIDGVTYQVEVDVWPSQATLDTIADVKNNPSKYDTLSDGAKQYLARDGSLKTNQDGDNAPTLTYSDSRTGVVNATVKYTNPAPVENSTQTMRLKKHWENDVDSKAKEPLTLDVNRDSKLGHYTLDLNEGNDFSGEVEISIGIMKVDKTNGTIELKTTGHDFTFHEPDGISYYWDFKSDTIHPMLINNVKTTLKLIDESEVPEGMGTKEYYKEGNKEYYKLGEKHYIVDSEGGSFSLDAYNNRRSFLNVTKEVTGEQAPEGSIFNYTMTVNDSTGADVWFNIKDENGEYVINDEVKLVQPEDPQTYVTGAEIEINDLDTIDGVTDIGEISEEGTITYKYKGTPYTVYATGEGHKFYPGSYSAHSGSTYTFKLKAGWTLQVRNIPGQSTVTVVETNDMEEGYVFKSVSGFGEANGSSVSGTVASNNEYTIKYVNEYVLKDINVTKVWQDNDNQDNIRPNVTINLLADGRVIDHVTLDGETDEGDDLVTGELEAWKATFGNLPVYKDGTDTKIVYTVAEDTSDTSIFNENGYTMTGPVETSESEYTITNTHTPKTVTIEGTKTWNDGPGENRPNVTINLLADGTKIKDVTLPKNGSWDYSFTDLPKNKNVTNEDGTVTHGVEIEYTITEEPVANYTTEIDGTNVINTLVKSIEVTKTWDDGNNENRPESITVNLLADGEVVGTEVLNAGNDWKHTFENLPVYNGQTEIEYTVKEISVEEYNTTIDGYNIKNVLQTSITVNKSWNDANNQDGIRPGSVEVTLLADGTSTGKKATITPDNDGNWSYTFENLDKYNSGTEIVYSVEETAIEGYEATYSKIGDTITVTNTHTPETTEVSGTKTWKDGNSNNRPNVTINLLADGTKIKEIVLPDKDGSWDYSFTELPKYKNVTNDDGTVTHKVEIVYTVTETPVANYTTEQNGNNFVNTLVKSVEVTKTWDDGNSNNRPTSITVKLLADGVEVDTTDLTSENGWKHTFENLPVYDGDKEINYTVEELTVDGYRTTIDGYNIKNVLQTSITVNKSWDDANNQDGIRPGSIVITLLKDGETTGNIAVIIPDDNGNWSYTFSNLDKYNNGTEIVYSVEETPIDGYVATYSKTGNTITVTNTHEPEKVEVSGTKTWNDGPGENRPNVTINLLADGTKIKDITLPGEDGSWDYSFTDLPKYKNVTNDDGTVTHKVEIVYTVTETSVANYTTEQNGNDFVNTLVKSVEVTKTWDDGNNENRPESITVNLLADGKVVGTEVLNAGNDWKHTFENLPVYNGQTEIEYTVKEISVEGYNTTIDGYEITNVLQTSITVNKSWDDGDNQDGIRPGSVEVTLLADGTSTGKKATITPDNEGNWSYTFENLDKYNSGTEIVYSVEETAIEGYEATYSKTGDTITVTNTHVPEKVEVSGTKTWKDGNSNNRPNVTINLLADGTKIKEITLPDKDGSWDYSFTELPKYKNVTNDDGTVTHKVEIAYTVTETPVANYTTEQNGNNFVNTLVKSVEVTKTWDDGNSNNRPTSITVKLLADGVEVDTTDLTSENGWKHTFENLPVYDGDKEISYTVEELTVDGYRTTIDGYDIKNVLQTSITVNKSWNDANNQDGIRPGSVEVTLLADGTSTGKKATITPNNEGNWSYTFENLDKYNNGTEIVYSVEETPVDGYVATYSKTGNTITVTNTHRPEKTQVSGTKTWDDADNQDGKRPGSITINLLIDGKPTGTKAIVMEDADGNWSYSFTDLDKYSGGKEINYSVSEDPVEGYTTTKSGNDFTNSYTPGKTGISGTKIWEDADNQDGIRPGSVKVTLWIDDVESDKTAILSDDNDWTYNFTDLPIYRDGGVQIKYEVKETPVSGYTTSYEGTNIINTHVPDTTEVSGTKTWEDANNQDGKRPASIIVTLYADGTSTGKTATVSAETEWGYSFTELPMKSAGKNIDYTVVETPVEGYDISYDGYNITNTYSPETTSISGTKTWNDANNQDGIRPSSVTVTLLVDGVESKTATLNESNGWSYSFTNLPRYRNGGVLIKYSIKEISVDGYKTSYQGNDIINTHVPETTEVSGTKIWKDADDQDGKRPASIKVNLLADGETYKTTVVTPDSEGNWNYSFTDLPKNKAGKAINYSISEEKVANYTTTYEGNNIINSYTPEITSVSVKKNWVDEDDRDGARPASITFNLTATVGTDKTVISKAVTADDNWSYTFDNLPVYAGGKLITYTVSESEVVNYVTSEEITGSGTTTDPYVITNTHTPERIKINGVKTWDDNNDENGMRPSEIYITLYGNEKKMETKKVVASEDANNWSFEFTNLYKYENKTEIAYTIKETDANGREAAIQDYVSLITGNFKDGYEVKNTYKPETISIPVTKEWVDGNNAEGIRPSSITVNLFADGTKVKDATITPDENGKWTYTFTDLNKYKDKKEIKYTITENPVAEYTTTFKGDYVIVNTYDPNNYAVSGVKTWDDNNDAMGMRPEEITIYLSGKDGSEEVVSKEVKVKEVNGEWKYSFTELPKYHNGNLINYTVSEADIQDYSAEIKGYDIKNIYTPDTITVSGSKVWNDEDNQDGIRPTSIVVKLLADGEETGKTATVTPDEEGNWEFKFEGLTKYKNKEEIEYTVEEEMVEGYTPSVVDYEITNTHKPATITFTASKEWYDEGNNDGIRPDSITVNLFKKVDETRTFVKSQVITAADGWTYTFENLPKFEAGKLIVYDIEEDEVPGYTADIQGALVGDTNTTQVIYNIHEPDTTIIIGEKIWEDNNDQDGIRPDTITVHLYANGVEVDSMEVSADTNWYYEFDNLRVFENQKEIVYEVVEDEVEGYETSYDGDNIINTHVLETIDITVTKVWSDYDNYDKIRPESVSVDLLANGEKMGTFELNEANDWTMVIKGLYKNAGGVEIIYTVEEHEVEFYETTYSVKDYNYTITNTHEPQKGDTDIIDPPHTGVEIVNIPYEYVVFYDDRKKYYF